LLLFLGHNFIVIYKLGKIHVIIDALSILLDITEPIGLPDQTINASSFYTKPKWHNDVKDFLKTCQIEGTLFI
jgi:hypothetical protein